MKLKTLNKSHKQIIENFTTEIQSFIYSVTEDSDFEKFRNFKPVLSNAEKLHNNLYENLVVEGDIDDTEFCYMLPNYLLFASIGFAAGIKTRDNEDYINTLTDELFSTISETICDLEAMVEKRKYIKQKKQQLKND